MTTQGRGWRIDELGNAEVESIRVRSFNDSLYASNSFMSLSIEPLSDIEALYFFFIPGLSADISFHLTQVALSISYNQQTKDQLLHL